MIYLDNAATTRMAGGVMEGIAPYLTYDYSNPSAIYQFSEESAKQIEESRRLVAEEINAEPDEIYFTSGGSESNSWVFSQLQPRDHALTTKIEHHSIIEASKRVRTNYLPVDDYGFIDLDRFYQELDSYFYNLISIQFANNEIGTIQDIKKIGRICHQKHLLFHTDAVQAFGHLPIDVKEMNIDFLSASGHKIGAPKGVGFLYIRKGLEEHMSPLIYGSQENGLRGGTYNVPGIVGFGRAVETLSYKDTNELVSTTRDYLAYRIGKEIPFTHLNGAPLGDNRLPNNLNITFTGIKSEQLLYMLGEEGIYVSAGSACAAGSGVPSHVLTAIGLTPDEASNTIRFSLSADTTNTDVDYVVTVLKDTIKILRALN